MTTPEGQHLPLPTSLPVRDPVTNYEKIKRIGEGTYGVVYKARDRTTGEVVALKKILMHREKDGVPLTAIRELRVLQSCGHPNIVALKKVVTGSKPDSVFMVFEYCEHDMGRLLDSMPRPFSEAEVKCLMQQLLEAVEWLHSRSVMHRDMKLCNILMTRHGRLKLCDFGLARYVSAYDESYTPGVVTLWYRAPELLMGMTNYTDKIDLWGVGCIMGELLKHAPLFPGRTEIAMLDLFTKLLGSPHDIWKDFNSLPHADKLALTRQPYNFLEQELPKASPASLNLLNQLLTYDPKKRISASRALKHPWFKQHPLAVLPEAMPTFPSTQDAHNSPSKRSAADAVDKGEQRQKVEERFGQIFGSAIDTSHKRARAV